VPALRETGEANGGDPSVVAETIAPSPVLKKQGLGIQNGMDHRS
jgi:hypothetical protein